jgi:hypothetical protein
MCFGSGRKQREKAIWQTYVAGRLRENRTASKEQQAEPASDLQELKKVSRT